MVPCTARTCGAKVKGTSFRSSAINELFSKVWPALFSILGLATVTQDEFSLPVSKGWLPSASEVLPSVAFLCSCAVSPKRTNPSASVSGAEGFLDSGDFLKKGNIAAV